MFTSDLCFNFVDLLFPILESNFLNWIQQPNSVIAILAIFISLFGLVFSVIYNRKTIKITIRHNELSVKPLLQFSVLVDNNVGLIKYDLSNRGLGPALFDYLVYKYEDETYNNINELFNSLKDRIKTSKDLNYNIDYRELKKNTVISANDTIQLFSIKLKPENYTDSTAKLIENVNIEIFYRDMYNNQFTNR